MTHPRQPILRDSIVDFESFNAPVYRVLHARGGSRLRLGGRITDPRDVRLTLFPISNPGARPNPSAGVWVSGGPADVRQFLARHSLRPVVHAVPRHGAGRNHVHGATAGGRRSTHIFYGRPPRGLFFE
jgi:hypothetical protein